jgi:exosortase
LNTLSSLKSKGWGILAGWVILCIVVFWKPLAALIHLAAHNDDASHVFLIPFITIWLLYLDRRILAQQKRVDFSSAIAFIALAAGMAVATGLGGFKEPSDRLTGYILVFVLLLAAGFLGVFGRTAAKTSKCALGFLLFLVPLPEALLNRVIYGLQAGSAAVAGLLFDLFGVPALREGFVFHLPRISIEVAQECSGIRSSIALLILAVLVAHFAFQTMWKKLIFIVAGLVMMLVKNGVRIATLTILANYVDPDFLYGRLHHDGGVVFFLVGLGLMVPIYWFLKKGEPNDSGARMAGPEPAKP